MTTQIKVGVIADNAVTSAKIAENSITAREVSSSASLSLVDLTLTGDLNITGDLNSLSVTDLDVADKTITLGAGGTAAANTGAGIIVDGASASILWDNTNTEWDFNNSINVTGNIGVSGTVDGRDLATDGSKLDGIESGATADQTQSDINSLAITEVGTISTGTWQGTAIADAYVANNLTISGGTIDNSVIGGTTAAAGTFTTIAGTLSTAAQTNITSVGTLSGLTVSGSGLTVNGDATFDTSTLVVDATNNRVGIGTTSPSYPLEVQSGGEGTVLRAGTSFVSIDSTGSASAPSLIFNGDGNSGIWRPASDTLAVSTAGSERMRIDSTGGVIFKGALASHQTNAGVAEYESNGFTLRSYGATAGTGFIRFLTGGGGGSAASEYMRIDSSGNVGIGTSSPSAALSISKQTTALSGTGNTYGLYLYPTSSGATYVDAITGSTSNTDLKLRSYNNGTYNQLIGSSSGGTVTTFQTGGSEAMRIDSSGNVVVGSTTANNVNAATLRQDGTAHVNNVQLANNAGSTGGTTPSIYSPAAATMAFSTNSGERMRIDSSGNLLVGKTSSNFNAVGVELKPNEGLIATVNGSECAMLNRQTSDGNILRFKKDGTDVGSISTRSSGLVIGNGDVGLFFDAALDRIFPESPSSGSGRDNAIDLGTSSTRFKDLHLSGTVNAATDVKVNGASVATTGKAIAMALVFG